MQLMDEEIKRRIWTCLEYTVRTHTELMRDRHLDQLIMCSLYIVCKVKREFCGAGPPFFSWAGSMSLRLQITGTSNYLYRILWPFFFFTKPVSGTVQIPVHSTGTCIVQRNYIYFFPYFFVMLLCQQR